jgi:hypothetical protein
MSQKRFTASDERHFLVRTLAAEFRHQQVLAPHAHPWGQLIYSVSGVMSVWTEHGSWVAPPHWAVWARPRGDELIRKELCIFGASVVQQL